MEVEYNDERKYSTNDDNDEEEEEEEEEEKKENKRKNDDAGSIIPTTKPHDYLSRPFNEIISYFDGILNSKKTNVRFNNSDIEYVLTYHPDYDNKELVFLSELVVKRDLTRKLKKTRLYAIMISNEDGVIYSNDYISLNRCVRNALKPINEERIRKNHVGLAFYNTIRGYPIGFSMVACDFCIKCKKLRNVKLYCGENYRFSDLLEKFMKEMNLSFSQIDITIVRSGILLKDPRLADRWSTFYIKHCAKVEYICYTCIQIQLELQKRELDEAVMTIVNALCNTRSHEEEKEEDYMITSPHASIKSDSSSSSSRQCNNHHDDSVL